MGLGQGRADVGVKTVRSSKFAVLSPDDRRALTANKNREQEPAPPQPQPIDHAAETVNYEL